ADRHATRRRVVRRRALRAPRRVARRMAAAGAHARPPGPGVVAGLLPQHLQPGAGESPGAAPALAAAPVAAAAGRVADSGAADAGAHRRPARRAGARGGRAGRQAHPPAAAGLRKGRPVGRAGGSTQAKMPHFPIALPEPFMSSITLSRYLIEQTRNYNTPADLRFLIEVVARACRHISHEVSLGALGDVLGSMGTENVQGEVQKKLD